MNLSGLRRTERLPSLPTLVSLPMKMKTTVVSLFWVKGEDVWADGLTVRGRGHGEREGGGISQGQDDWVKQAVTPRFASLAGLGVSGGLK